MGSIRRFLSKDHKRLNSLFGEYKSKKDTDLEKAKESFSDFKKELERHILLEDTVIKPILEKKGLMATKPDVDTTGEHEKIKSLLGKIEGEPRDTTSLEDELLETLKVHNEKEEKVLYNWVDNSLNVKEKAEVLGEMFKWVTR